MIKLSQYAEVCSIFIRNDLEAIESSFAVMGYNNKEYTSKEQYLKDVVFQIVNDWKDSEDKDITFDRAFQIMGVI